MADDWQVGDLALCVDDGPPRMIGGLIEAKREYVEALRRGRIYTVTHIAFGKTVDCIGLGDIHQKAGGVSSRFIKVMPSEADVEDIENHPPFDRHASSGSGDVIFHPPISAHGKQLLQSGSHLADCRSNEAAAAMAMLLNRAALILPTDAEVRIVRAGLGEISETEEPDDG